MARQSTPRYVLAYSEGLLGDYTTLRGQGIDQLARTTVRKLLDGSWGRRPLHSDNPALAGIRVLEANRPDEHVVVAYRLLPLAADPQRAALHVAAVGNDRHTTVETAVSRLNPGQRAALLAFTPQVNEDFGRLPTDEAGQQVRHRVREVIRGLQSTPLDGEDLYAMHGADLRGCRQLGFTAAGSRWQVIHMLLAPPAGGANNTVLVAGIGRADSVNVLNAAAARLFRSHDRQSLPQSMRASAAPRQQAAEPLPPARPVAERPPGAPEPLPPGQRATAQSVHGPGLPVTFASEARADIQDLAPAGLRNVAMVQLKRLLTGQSVSSREVDATLDPRLRDCREILFSSPRASGPEAALIYRDTPAAGHAGPELHIVAIGRLETIHAVAAGRLPDPQATSPQAGRNTQATQLNRDGQASGPQAQEAGEHLKVTGSRHASQETSQSQHRRAPHRARTHQSGRDAGPRR